MSVTAPTAVSTDWDCSVRSRISQAEVPSLEPADSNGHTRPRGWPGATRVPPWTHGRPCWPPARVCGRLHVTHDGTSMRTSSPLKSREKVRAHRERLRRRGLRPIQIWVPDVRSPEFAREAHRQSEAVAVMPGRTKTSSMPCLAGMTNKTRRNLDCRRPRNGFSKRKADNFLGFHGPS